MMRKKWANGQSKKMEVNKRHTSPDFLYPAALIFARAWYN